MATKTRRRGGARLVEREAGELTRPFRDVGESNAEANLPPEPDPLELAFERGLREGTTQAEALAEQRLEHETSARQRELVAALAGVTELEQRLRVETMELMTGLALETASRIVRERIELDDPVAARALSEAVAALPEIDGLTARLHPDDVSAVSDGLSELIERQRIELKPDESIERGGCVVESRAGSIDARLETAIEAVRLAARGERA